MSFSLLSFAFYCPDPSFCPFHPVPCLTAKEQGLDREPKPHYKLKLKLYFYFLLLDYLNTIHDVQTLLCLLNATAVEVEED